MKKLNALFKLICLTVLSFQIDVSNAQIVNVSQLYGAATINITVYIITCGKIVIPISISNYGNGVRAKIVQGSAVINWQLTADGSITHKLKDVPDDLADNSRGRLYKTKASKISNFSIANLI